MFVEKNGRQADLLALTPQQEERTLKIDPKLKGAYRITFGLQTFSSSNKDHNYYGPAIKVRLDNEPYRLFLRPKGSRSEVEFKVADLTGRKLEISSIPERPVYIEHIRFEPVTKEAFAEIQNQEATPHQWDVVGINDVNVWMWRYSSRTEQDFKDIVGQHKYAGFNRLYWMANAGALFYHSRVGTRFQGDKRPHTKRSGYMVENFRPLESGVKYAHEMDMGIWGWYRLNNNFGSQRDLQEYGPGLNSKFFMDHPEYRLIRKNGQPDPSKYSFAYPEVREYVRKICVEMVEKGVEGLLLDLLRSPPLAGYEPHLVEGFLQKFGKDPRKLTKADNPSYQQWITYRARHSFTAFVLELKEDLKKIGKPIPLGIRCSLGPLEWNLEQGMDVKGLVEKGLLSEICLMNGYMNKPELSFAPNKIAIASKPYFRLCEEGNIKLICGLTGRPSKYPQEYAKHIYAAGYNGIAIYESELWLNQPHYRPSYQRLKRATEQISTQK